MPLVSRGVRLPALALLGTSLVLTQLYFPTRYLEVAQLGAIDWLVVARNLTVVALFVVLLRGLQNLAVERVPAIDYTGTTTDGSVVATAAL